MSVLSFSLSPEATGRIYEQLVCLAKFGESVSIEARSEKARLHHDHHETLPDYLLTAIAHNHRSELIKDSVRIVCVRREKLLHRLRLQRQQLSDRRRPLHVPAPEQG